MKVIRRLRQEVANFAYELSARLIELEDVVSFDVPYTSQFSIPGQAEPTLTKSIAPRKDPHWEASGATSSEQYADWAFTMCGMACTSMILEFFTQSKIAPVVLAEDALQHGVYVREPQCISDMKYQPYVSWINKYALKAKFYTILSIRGIQRALTVGDLVFVSVNPNIRGFETASTTQKGGHLVVVTGYNLKDQTITINNPSGFASTNTQHHHKLSLNEFKKYYAGRGIIISTKD
jgi:hypothetical protein